MDTEGEKDFFSNYDYLFFYDRDLKERLKKFKIFYMFLSNKIFTYSQATLNFIMM